jgi:hypothetical protein
VNPKDIDLGKAVGEWISGRRRGYMAAGFLALTAGIIAVMRLDTARGAQAAETAAALEAARRDSIEAANRSVVGSRGVVPVAKPEHVRALYLNAWAAGSSKKLAKLIDIANQTDINAFVVDVKEAGEISYPSEVKLANEIGATRQYIRDARVLLAKLKENDIYPIARIVCFKDPVLAKAQHGYAIHDKAGELWLDNKGKAWVDSYNQRVWDYNIAIAREAVELGFAEVQWDYVRFPDAPRSYLERAVYTAAAGRAKDDAIREFMLYAREQLADLKVPITADVFGLTVTTAGDMGIGQRWEKMVDAVDVILPMVYPSHFIRGNYGLSNPNEAPYRTIQRSMEDALARSQPVSNAASIRPWLQAFTLGPPRYTPAYVWAQIQAVYDVGLKEWVLWNPGSNYDPAALHPEDGPPPEYEIPGGKGPPRKPKPDTLESKAVGAKSDTMTIKLKPDTVRRDTLPM